MDSWIWIAIYAGLFFVMMRYGCGAHMMGHGHSGHDDDEDHKGHDHHYASEEQDGTAMTRSTGRRDGVFVDPVCGMPVPRDEGYGKMYQGIPYRFCSRECLDKFDNNAERYTRGSAGKAA